jgi:hypothetical protein
VGVRGKQVFTIESDAQDEEAGLDRSPAAVEEKEEAAVIVGGREVEMVAVQHNPLTHQQQEA